MHSSLKRDKWILRRAEKTTETLAMRRFKQVQRLQLPLGQQTHKVAVC